MAIGVNIISDFDSKGINKAIEEFKKLETTSERSAFVLKKAFLPAAAVLSGLAVAAFQATKAAAEDEAEQSKLAQTLNKVVKATSETVASTEKMISAMSRATGTADTELREALSKLVIGTGSLEKAQKGLALAQDIATATGMPLVSAAQALSLAYNGNFRALQRLSPELKDLIKDGATTDEIFAKLSQTFGGATATAADTTAGKMKILKNNMAELSESLGAALLPALEKMTEIFTVVFGFMADHTTTVLLLAAGIGTLALAIVAYNIALKIATITQVAFGVTAEAAAIAAAPIAVTVMLVVLALVALGIGILLIVKHFDTLKKVFYIVVNAVIGFLEDLVNNFIGVLNTIINGINLLIKGANLFGAGLKPIGQIGEVSFGRVGVAAQQTKQQIENLERQALTAANAISAIGSGALTTGQKLAGQNKSNREHQAEFAARVKGAANMQDFFNKKVTAGGAAVETAAQKLAKYTDAINGVTDAQRSLRDANKSVTNATTKHNEAVVAVTKAQEFFNKVSKGYALDSKEVVKQTRGVADAQRSLIKANISAADSVQAVKKAEEALTKLREKVNPYDIESGEIAIEKSRFDLEQANFAVLDAEKDLAELRLDPKSSAQTIRAAEIKLAESKFNVRDATQKIKDAEKDLNKLRNETPTLQEIKDAERAVADAKLAAVDATIAQTDSQTQFNEAQEKLNELINGATKDSESYKDALKELQDAQKEEVDATDAVTAALERQTDAVKDLAKAEKERRDAGKDVPAAAKKAADAAAEAVAVVVEAVKTVAAVVPAVAAGGLTQDILDQLNGRRGFVPSLLGGFGGGGGGIGGGLGEMFAFAKGGIVTSPMIGMVGESGAEAIIPLDRLGNMGSTYNISVTAGMGADGKDIGTQIVNALKRYERTNGAIPISVA